MNLDAFTIRNKGELGVQDLESGSILRIRTQKYLSWINSLKIFFAWINFRDFIVLHHSSNLGRFRKQNLQDQYQRANQKNCKIAILYPRDNLSTKMICFHCFLWQLKCFCATYKLVIAGSCHTVWQIRQYHILLLTFMFLLQLIVKFEIEKLTKYLLHCAWHNIMTRINNKQISLN